MSGQERRPNDHRRIAWRLSGRIAWAQVAAFIAADVFLVFLILLYRADPVVTNLPYIDDNLASLIYNLRAIRYLDIVSLWGLVSLGVVQILLVIGHTVELRKYIRKQFEPLRELRVAADAFSGAAYDGTGADGGAEALRRMAEALSHVEAGDMSAHITKESVSPELRPLLEAITDMLNRLEDAYAAQTKFVSDASHELRTPIAVIQGYANLLSRWGSEDPDTLSESIEAIRSEAESMKQMVNQLLFLARGDSDTLTLDMQRVDLTEAMGEVMREVLMLDGAGHEISSKLPEGGVFVSGDPALIKQLIRILVDNSLKYTPEGGEIILSVAEDAAQGRALVIVQDEGEGISGEALPLIFDRFVRADEARSRSTGGAGLGLSIAKQIAERHNGALEVYSALGVGSRFTAAFPLLCYPTELTDTQAAQSHP